MKYLTEQELLLRFEYYALEMENQLLQGADFHSIANDLPFAVHLNDAQTLEVAHTNESHSKLTGHSLEEVREMGWEFLERCVHPDSLAMLPKFLPPVYAEKDAAQSFQFVQHLRLWKQDDYSPVITFTKASRLPNGLVLCLSPIPSQFGKLAPKIERVIEIDTFRLNNFSKFRQLSNREVEILRLLSQGLNNSEISARLFISRQTVETHRKRIKAKLDIKSFRDVMRYALAFELIAI